VNREEIEQRFASAGWDLDGSFAEHLIIGYNGDGVSLLAHKEDWGPTILYSRSSIMNRWSTTGLRIYLRRTRPRNSYENMASRPR
jgi:hypothetical protein